MARDQKQIYRLNEKSLIESENTLYKKCSKNGLVSEKISLFFCIIGGEWGVRTLYGIFP